MLVKILQNLYLEMIQVNTEMNVNYVVRIVLIYIKDQMKNIKKDIMNIENIKELMMKNMH